MNGLAAGGGALPLVAVAALLVALVAALLVLRGARSALAALRGEADSLRSEHEMLRSESGRAQLRLRESEIRLEARADALAQAGERNARLESDLARLTAEHGALQRANAALQADHDGRIREAGERLAEMKEMREKMRAEFADLAQATLRRTGEDFSKAHLERLTGLLTPFREHVGRFEQELRQVHKSADEERARLSEQIRLLSSRSEAISAEAVALTRALKGDSQRQGAWGEMVLERILEDSGLVEGTHYDRQKSRTDEEGARWRPDVVVRMPRGKVLVIDSKVSLTAYEAAVSAGDEEERARQIKAHVLSMRRHVEELAAKGYGVMEAGSVDYVLMFVPVEGALSEALREQGDLGSVAVGRGVGLVTPTTLMLALRTVDHIWTVERREQNAEEIARRAGLLHDKLVGFTEDMARVDRALGGARDAFEDAMGKLARGRGNLVGQADKLQKLGARAGKTIAIPFDEEEDEAPARIAAPGEGG